MVSKLSEFARKEIVSILLIIVGVISFIYVCLLMAVFMFPDDSHLFCYQCALMTTSVYCFFFAFGTWFYNSNLKRHRKHARIYFVTLMSFNCLLLLGTDIAFLVHFASKLYEYFDGRELLSVGDLIIIWLAGIGGLVLAAVLIAINVWLIVFKILRRKHLCK